MIQSVGTEQYCGNTVMKVSGGKAWLLAVTAFLCLVVSVFPMYGGDTVWHDASRYPLIGKTGSASLTRYERLPAALQGKVRDAVWYLGRNSAGLAVRFRSNSTSVKAKWTSMFSNSMNHMTETGVRGLDLYVLEDGQWRFAGVGRPEGKTTDAVLVQNMTREAREYMLYLSLYDGVEDLSIGIEEGSSIGQPEADLPDCGHPVVMYGTSILQGGCASRPGMAHTNILGRMLGREVINLGFSGNALLDYEIAGLMASVETPGAFVLDYVPNASAKQIAERGETFFRILRDAHPDVPVIFIEDPQFPHTLFNKRIAEEVDRKNKEQKALYGRLKRQGFRKLFYITSENLIGDDGEATVDAIHFTDLGASRYASKVIPVIRKALRKCR